MVNEYILDAKDEAIINGLDNLFGVVQNKEVLRNIIIFSKLKRDDEINTGNFNIIIRNNSDYNLLEDFLRICTKLFVKNNIIENDKIYFFGENEDKCKGRKNNDIWNIELKNNESLIVFKCNSFYINYKRDRNKIEKLIKKYPNKIFIFEDTNYCEGEMDAELGNIATWRMTIEKISLDDKIIYCKNILDKNKIKYRNQDIRNFSEQPFWKLKPNLLQLMVECKANRIESVNSEMFRKKGEKYNIKPIRKYNTKSSKKSAKADLEELIGLDEIKSEIRKILNYVSLNKERGKMPTLHMCFYGNPGTGKTSVARVIGKLFAEERILPGNGDFVEVHGRDLVAKFVGWTAQKVHEVVGKAIGGVLFIDEAYSLISRGRGGFESEAIDTLIKEMEDHRDEICIILAGYTDEMKELLKENPGFESRIQFNIDFPDYTANELLEIFNELSKKEKYCISNNCREILLDHFNKVRSQKNFGNGRYVRNIFEKIKFEQADRVIRTNCKSMNRITKSDVQNALIQVQMKQENNCVRKMIGF